MKKSKDVTLWLLVDQKWFPTRNKKSGIHNRAHETMKRRLHDNNNPASSRRPKRMIVPSSSQEDFLTQSVYEWNWNEFLQETTQQRTPRPLPSSTVLASLVPAASQGLDMPLLQHLKPLIKGYNEQESPTQNTTVNNDALVVVDAIDDKTSSTLTRGQHARYLQLESGSESWNVGRRKEFRKLSQRVQQEQELYRQAMEVFWERHVEQYKIGLQHQVARYCMAYAKLYHSSYRGARHFGPCSQVISLQHVSKAAFTDSARVDTNNNLTLDSFSSRVVHETNNGEKRTIVAANVDWDSVVPVWNESNIPPVSFLDNDVLALELAKQHGASIVTTEETLQTLLQVSGDELTHWMIPMTRRRHGDGSIVLLDLPIPRPNIPRTCVSKGVTEGLYQALLSASKCASNDTDDRHQKDARGYTYILLTLPGNAGTHKPSTKSRNILVRSRRRLYTNAAAASDQPQSICIQSQLEYFFNCRACWEESTSYERAGWILNKLLLYQETRLARVDPSTMKVLLWEQVGVAHALAFSKQSGINQTRMMDPMNHFQALVQVLYAMDTLPAGEHVLCLPSASTSISVHAACPASTTTSADATIDLEQEFKNADAVYTGAVALRQCARAWRWNEDRIPYTFPIKEESGKGAGSNKGRKSATRR